MHSDQGPDFELKTIKELCDLAGIHKVRTTPYHPRGNPVERFNRTLLNMLGTLKTSKKQHWRDFVKPLVHVYNCTKYDTTGFTPYELMFGWQPRLSIDLAFNVPLNRHQHKSHSKYVQTLKNHLQESYQLATKNAAKTAERNTIRFDKHVTESTLDVGDRVLVRNVRLRGKHKLADKWEGTVHVVVNRKADLPVYTVRPENQDGPLRTSETSCYHVGSCLLKLTHLQCQINLAHVQVHVFIQISILMEGSQSLTLTMRMKIRHRSFKIHP